MIFPADLDTVTCSEIREALSAAYDGEAPPDGPDSAAVAAHVAGCPGCTAYRDALVAVRERTDVAARETGPDLAARVVATRRAHPRRLITGVLRWGVALAAIAELLTQAWLAWDPATAPEGHDAHESLAFTVALCIGLLCAAFQPRLAGGYLPIIGMASLLLVVCAGVDVQDQQVTVRHELSHIALVVGFLLLAALAWTHSGRPGLRLPAWRRHRPAPAQRPQLRLLRGAFARRWVRIAAAAGLAGVLVLIAGPASAHAVLESSTPAPGTVIATAPATVVLHYDENVTLLPTSLRIFAPDGSRADNGIVTHTAGDSTGVQVGFTGTEKGTYLVSWRVISADSHPVSGAYTFSVGTTSAAPTAATLSNRPSVAGLLGVARWAGYAGSALLVGGLGFLALCWRDGARDVLARRVLLVGAVLLGVASLVDVLAKGALDAGLGLSAFGRGSLVHEVVGTSYGKASLVRIGLAVVGAVVAFLAGRLGRGLGAVGLLLGVCVAGSFAFAGHAVAQSHQALALVIDGLHVLAASLWLGGLAMVLVALRRAADAGAVAKRFSAAVLGVIVVLVGTGIYQAWREVGAWGAFTATTYGKELLVKIGVVVVVLAVAAASRQVLWRAGAARLGRTVAIEVVGLGVVLGLTSALVATQPAESAYHPTVSANLNIEGDLVQVSAVPVGDRTMDLHLYVFGADQQQKDPTEIDATVSLPSQSIGPLPVKLSNGGLGHRLGTVSVPIAGTWQLAVTVREGKFDEGTKTVDLPIR